MGVNAIREITGISAKIIITFSTLFMNHNYLQEIKNRLKKVENKKQRHTAITGLLKSIAAISVVSFFIILLESVFHFHSLIRTVILFIFLLFGIALLIIRFFIPFLKSINIIGKINIYETAAEIGNYFPQIKDELLDVLQLASRFSDEHHSKELADAAFNSVYEKTKDLDFEIIAANDKIKDSSKFTVSILTTIIFLIYFLPFLSSASLRLVNFNKEFITPPKFVLTVEPGNTSILKGKSQKITVTAKGESPNRIELFTKSSIESEFRKRIMKIELPGKFTTRVSQIKQSFEYYAKSGSIESEHFNIKVLNPPIIKNLTVKITPPKYTGLPQIVQRDNGNISTLFGSRIRLNFSSTKEMKSGKLIFAYNKGKKILLDGKNGEVKFQPKKDGNYFIQIEDTAGNKNSNPIVYSIKLSRDKYPTLEVISPKNNINVVGNELLPVELKIGDDFGYSKLLLHYKLSSTKFGEPETKYHSIRIAIKSNSIEENVYYNWDLSQLYLAVDDEISYYFQLFDNDDISGPKSVRSELMRLRVPSMDETFTDVDKTQKQADNELKNTLEETKKLNAEINKLHNNLKRDEKKISWEEKKKIENTVKKFNELEKKVENIKEQINEAKKKLDKNNLLSKETLQKYNELQKLMEELSSPEMKAALKKLQEMMAQMNRDKVQNSFQNFKMNEEAFMKSLERTVNLLKRIQIEQKLDELTKRTDELEKRQKKLNEETKKESSKENQKGKKELQKKQDEITKGLRKLSEKMKDLQKMMSEVPKMPNNKMQKMMKEMQQQKNQQLSKQASQAMKQQIMQSMKNQQQIAKNMKQLNQQLSAMKSQMQMQNQMQTMTEMMKIISQIIDLSKEEELLKKDNKNISPTSTQADNNARKQEEIKNNLGKLLRQMSALSQKTFAISPEMGKALGKALRNMGESQMAMENRNGALALMKQGDAMGQLNEAAKMMNNALQSMMKPGGQGGGMMSLMQQLKKLSGQQMSLNQLTQQLGKNGMTQQQMAQLQRLAQQQSIIKKSMQELNKEAKESGLTKKLPVDFDRVIQDMKEVITGMKTQKLDDNLIKTQKRILSKLLDAQRSINERDYEKRRESNSGTDIAGKSPGQLNLERNKKSEQIRRELLNSVKEGYSQDYQELIRKYFEALEKEKN